MSIWTNAKPPDGESVKRGRNEWYRKVQSLRWKVNGETCESPRKEEQKPEEMTLATVDKSWQVKCHSVDKGRRWEFGACGVSEIGKVVANKEGEVKVWNWGT
jgi:hypothetical protein